MRQDQIEVLTVEATDEIPVMEVNQVPEVYCDGACSAELIGDNVRVTYFALRRIGGTKMRVPVLEMVRPLKSFGQGSMGRLIAQARANARQSDEGAHAPH